MSESQRERIAPCSICHEVGPCRPYGPLDTLLCFPCARAREPVVEEALREFAEDLNEFNDPKNPTSNSVH